MWKLASFTTGVLLLGLAQGFAADSANPTGLRFVPVQPCRVADTRSANGDFGGPSLPGGIARTFKIPASSCNIPQTAAAYSFNVTVVPKGTLGFLTIYGADQPLPPVSNVNSPDGRVKAIAAIVAAGTSGAVSVFSTDPTDVVLDINGYFEPPTGNELAFYPITPCRILDTRWNQSPLGGPSLNAGAVRSFPMRSACGLPATAQAYSLNYIVVPKGGFGYLTTWPTGSQQPLVSTLNAPTGAVTSNAAIVPAGTNGDVSVFVTDPTDLVVDVNGYFAPAGAPGALSLYPLTPCRLVDTRTPAFSFGAPTFVDQEQRTYNVLNGACAIPTTAQAYVFNATVVPKGPLYYLSLFPLGLPQPNVSTLNDFDGSIVSNLAIVPAGSSGGIVAFATNATDLLLDVNAYFAP